MYIHLLTNIKKQSNDLRIFVHILSSKIHRSKIKNRLYGKYTNKLCSFSVLTLSIFTCSIFVMKFLFNDENNRHKEKAYFLFEIQCN